MSDRYFVVPQMHLGQWAIYDREASDGYGAGFGCYPTKEEAEIEAKRMNIEEANTEWDADD